MSVHTHSSPTILHARLALAQPSSTVARVMLCNMYADAIRLCLSLMPQSSPNRRTAPSPQMEILLPALDESIENTARAIVFTLMSRIDTLHEGRNRHPIVTQANWNEQRNYSLSLIADDFKVFEANTNRAREAFIQAASYSDYRFSNMDLAHTQFTRLCTDTSAHLKTVHSLLRQNSVLGVSPPTTAQNRIVETAFANIESRLRADGKALADSAAPETSLAVKIMHGLLSTKIGKSLEMAHKMMSPGAADSNRSPILLAGPVLTQLQIYQQPDQLKAAPTVCDTPEQMLCHEVITILRTLKTHVERDHYRELVQSAACNMSNNIAGSTTTQRDQSYDRAKQEVVCSLDGALAILDEQVNSLSHLTELGHTYFNTPNRSPFSPNPSRYLS